MIEVIRNYVIWHYTTAYVDQIYILKHYAWFVKRFFSVPEVLGSLIAPWKRMGEEGGDLIKDPSSFFEAIIINTVMRLVGLMVRIFLLAIALVCFVTLMVIFVVSIAGWTFLPFAVVFSLIKGVALFIP